MQTSELNLFIKISKKHQLSIYIQNFKNIYFPDINNC